MLKRFQLLKGYEDMKKMKIRVKAHDENEAKEKAVDVAKDRIRRELTDKITRKFKSSTVKIKL